MGMPTAWVTGAAGFIGGHLCTALLTAGWRVMALDNLQAAHAADGWQRLSALSAAFPSQLSLRQIDVCELPYVQASESLPWPDCVFHLAAQPGVRTTEDLDFYLQANLVSTEALIAAIAEKAHHSLPLIVFASSSSVYGEGVAGQASAESSHCQPRSVYGQSKQRCEDYLSGVAAQKGFKSIALRLFSVYGAYQRPDMAFQRWAHALLRQQPVILHAPHQMSRDFTCVADVVQGFLKAARYGRQMTPSYACFNVGSGVQTPLLSAAELWLQQLERAASQTLGCSLQPHLETRSAHRAEVFHTWANLEQSQRLLGYQPRYTLSVGLTTFAQHVVDQHTNALTICKSIPLKE